MHKGIRVLELLCGEEWRGALAGETWSSATLMMFMDNSSGSRQKWEGSAQLLGYASASKGLVPSVGNAKEASLLSIYPHLRLFTSALTDNIGIGQFMIAAEQSRQ